MRLASSISSSSPGVLSTIQAPTPRSGAVARIDGGDLGARRGCRRPRRSRPAPSVIADQRLRSSRDRPAAARGPRPRGRPPAGRSRRAAAPARPRGPRAGPRASSVPPAPCERSRPASRPAASVRGNPSSTNPSARVRAGRAAGGDQLAHDLVGHQLAPTPRTPSTLPAQRRSRPVTASRSMSPVEIFGHADRVMASEPLACVPFPTPADR